MFFLIPKMFFNFTRFSMSSQIFHFPQFPTNLESFLHFFQDYFSNDKIKMAANIPLHFGYAPG